ncbi:UNVERIFIED_CONTAM: hypothetical protein RMT77_012980 [Armadillidium vulgare]
MGDDDIDSLKEICQKHNGVPAKIITKEDVDTVATLGDKIMNVRAWVALEKDDDGPLFWHDGTPFTLDDSQIDEDGESCFMVNHKTVQDYECFNVLKVLCQSQ